MNGAHDNNDMNGMNDVNDMDDERFDELMSRLLDEELTPEEMSQLVRLVQDHPDRQGALQSQLETAEMLAQSEDELRKSSLFLSTLESRLGDLPSP